MNLRPLALAAALASAVPAASAHHRHRAHPAADAEVVPHPAGCPRVAFCACGASVYLFGRARRDLMAAAAWFRFPRAAPAPRTVAVRAHHVFVLIAPVGGSVWRVYDANSGGHLTRVHERSIAGYAIVAPD